MKKKSVLTQAAMKKKFVLTSAAAIELKKKNVLTSVTEEKSKSTEMKEETIGFFTGGSSSGSGSGSGSGSAQRGEPKEIVQAKGGYSTESTKAIQELNETAEAIELKVTEEKSKKSIEMKETIGVFTEGSSSGSGSAQREKEGTPKISMAIQKLEGIVWAKGNATESTEAIQEMNETVQAKERQAMWWFRRKSKLMMMWLLRIKHKKEMMCWLRRKKKSFKCRRQRRKKETKERMANANEETDESTVEAKEETNDVCVAVAVEEQAGERRPELLMDLQENMGKEARNKLIVTRLIRLQKTAIVEDTNVYPEENMNETMQRANALDPKLGVLHDECAKSTVDRCISTMRDRHSINYHEMIRAATRLGGFNNDGELMLAECVKSAAELCIKNMRLGALVDKLDKRILLEGEITELREAKIDLMLKLVAFKWNFKFKTMECDEKVVLRSFRKMNLSSLGEQCSRVLLEMVNGYRFGAVMEDHEVDEAMGLAKTWVRAVYWKSVVKVCVGVLIDKHSVGEVLKREIGEAWRMEKEVNDKLVIYERKYARGRDTVVVGETNGLHKVGVYCAVIRYLVVVYLMCWLSAGKRKGVNVYGPWEKVSLLLVVMVFWVVLSVLWGSGRRLINKGKGKAKES